jgi:hypothetical protein
LVAGLACTGDHRQVQGRLVHMGRSCTSGGFSDSPPADNSVSVRNNTERWRSWSPFTTRGHQQEGAIGHHHEHAAVVMAGDELWLSR